MQQYEFNINEYVQAQITEYGWQQLEADHDALLGAAAAQYPFKRHKEDADGWSEWQLWDLMESIGKHMHLGMRNTPMRTRIKFTIKEPPHA